MNTTPLLKDLYQYITPRYAVHWKVIGTLLGLSSTTLAIIEHDDHYKAKECCNAMLNKWLEMDTTASWGKLFTVTESSAVSCSAPDKAKEVTILSKRVRQINEQTQFMVGDKTWPPEQPTNFIPLLLIQRQGYRTREEATRMAKLMHSDDHEKFHKMSDTSRAIKDIEEILAPLKKGITGKSPFILVEGAPGIGKTVLLKEIAYKWADNKILQNFEFVLLVYLRDPFLQQIKSVNDLLRLFCKGDENATQIVNACAQYLFDNGGKTLTLLLDGYDEYPRDLQESSLITDIIKRQVLPLCGLVVSSRPHASLDFHKQATIRVDILGFDETEREHYIKQSLPDQSQKVKELTQYLHQHPSIDSICCSPINMAILLYLYKLGILPKNSAELYHHFICSTICRHISKFGNVINEITDLTDLPDPYSRIIQQLSKLSLEALNKNKLTFTLHDIKAACPDIVAISGDINGFGFLQAVKHFGPFMQKMTLNFIHLTIQEFLAAHYISHLPPEEELKVIEANFWNNDHSNMFSIYISLTKGQRYAFKKFLSGGNKAIAISDKFLKDQLKCLILYRCFNEAGDHTLCNTIEQASIFHNKEIRLGGTTLTGSDMECISLFLTSSFNKEWKWLNLTSCHIQDKGLNILYRGLRHRCDITIDTLGLNYNGLTTQTSSLISELTVKCKVKVLGINGNHTIGEDQQLYSILTDLSSVLVTLIMMDTQLSSRAASNLFTAVKDNNKLKELDIEDNDITDDACDTITTALEKNCCLVKLSICDNPLSNEAIVNILQCLKNNDTLQFIGLSECPEDIQENIRSLQKVVNKNRASRGCQEKLEINFSVL